METKTRSVNRDTEENIKNLYIVVSAITDILAEMIEHNEVCPASREELKRMQEKLKYEF